MTGTISVINTASASGVIARLNEPSVRFDIAAVLAFDQANLAVGQHVTFDLKGDGNTTAVNICVQRSDHASHGEAKNPSMVNLRYTGFNQTGSIRTYCFEWRTLGLEKKTFFVTTDLELFTRHHLGIQEGPSLCLRLLLGELNAIDVETRPPATRSVTEDELVAYIASRPVSAKSGSKRKMRAAGDGSDGS